jgi:hypothetical protein
MTEQWELYRDNARLWLLRQYHLAEERIARGGVHTEKDAAALRLNMDVARSAFDRLSVCAAALAEERPNLALEAWHAAHALFEATYEIGGLSEISESADERVVTVETKFRTPERRRAAKKEKIDGPRTAALDAAILACVGGDRSKLSSYEAKMRPSHADVIARLPRAFRTGTWPAESTMRDRIIALKQSRSVT